MSVIGGFLFFIGFVRATAACQSTLDLKMPLLVGFFLAGLVIHFFGGTISPAGLLLGALLPTLIAVAVFSLL